VRFKTWPVAALALSALLLLVVVAVLESSRRAQEIYARLDDLNLRYHEVENKLRKLRSDVNMSGIYVRDYLLDPVRERAPQYRQRIAQHRSNSLAMFEDLKTLTRGRPGTDDRLNTLQAQLEGYWQSLDPLFDWTPNEKSSESASFLRNEVIPRREGLLEMATEIERLNDATLAAQRTEVQLQHARLRGDLYKLLAFSLLLGGAVAVTTVIRLRRLERRSDEQRAAAETAEQHMRELSQQLVATQEAERTNLSRELHDHVGQVLTALRMELGSIDRLRAPSDEPLGRAVQECRLLVDSMVRTVRDLALGLRPSMLDDFGLQPALEWHARDFTRRYGLPVHLNMNGDLHRLPDDYRTCIYRVVQEALTNCVRHAAATCIRVTVTGHPDGLDVTVVDDGIGFDMDRKKSGLGLRGIEERVRELGGSVEIRSVKGAGTSLLIRLPRYDIHEEAALARIAG
jgi:signal transduction histidine kinase